LQVSCETQAEIDRYWEQLSEGGDENSQRCGWLKDRFGVSWQIVPSILGKLMQSEDKSRSERVMNALLQMKKLDIAVLQQAYDGVVDR
jgi:predicted 3-demethylubiquinone-9 3-methyltransferase (glyoxalase superfamily)